MKHVIYLSVFFVALVFWGHLEVFSQKKQELELKRRNTLKEIQYTSQILDSAKVLKERSMQDLLILQKRIQLRENILGDLSTEINILEEKISEKQDVIESLTGDLERIKKEYEKLVLSAYKRKQDFNLIVYVLASETINQAHRRFQYIKSYTHFRKNQLKLIQAIQSTLYIEVVDLEKQINEKLELVQLKQNEQFKLSQEKVNKNVLISNLKKREKELKLVLKEKEKIAEELESEIKRIIELEAKNNSKFAKLTPEEKLISNNFSSNKGHLPWPTRQGIITGNFGEHDHPVLKGTKVRNNGIDISTVPHAEVRALFDGVVSKVIAILGANYTVIIRHGNFFTVYHNLSDISVKPGEKVYVKQPIGFVYSENGATKSVLHLEIWEEFEKLDPEVWLSRVE